MVCIISREDVNITYSALPVIEGYRRTNFASKLRMWRVPMKQPCNLAQYDYSFAAPAIASKDIDHAIQAVASSSNTAIAHNVYALPSIKRAVHWMHACLGYPAAATWIKACRVKKSVGFPFADQKYIRRYFPENDETVVGHMTRQRKKYPLHKAQTGPT